MNQILEQYRKNQREDLISCMQHFQDQYGYISEEIIVAISNYFGLPPNKVYGIATFYDYFTFTPQSGDVVTICCGTSCHMQGAKKLMEEAEKVAQQLSASTRKRLHIKTCGCQGACNAGPILKVNAITYTKVKTEDVKGNIQRGLSSEKEISNG